MLPPYFDAAPAAAWQTAASASGLFVFSDTSPEVWNSGWMPVNDIRSLLAASAHSAPSPFQEVLSPIFDDRQHLAFPASEVELPVALHSVQRFSDKRRYGNVNWLPSLGLTQECLAVPNRIPTQGARVRDSEPRVQHYDDERAYSVFVALVSVARREELLNFLLAERKRRVGFHFRRLDAEP